MNDVDKIKKSFKMGKMLLLFYVITLLISCLALIYIISNDLIKFFPYRSYDNVELMLLSFGLIIFFPSFILSLKSITIKKVVILRKLFFFQLPYFVGFSIAGIILYKNIIFNVLAIIIFVFLFLDLFLIIISRKSNIFYSKTKKKYKQIEKSNLEVVIKNEKTHELQKLYDNFDYQGVVNLEIPIDLNKADEENRNISYYDSNFLSNLAGKIIRGFLLIISLGILYPFVKCMKISYEIKHTKYDGKSLYFDGNGLQLIGKWILWMLLSIVTLGIFLIFIPNKITKWRVHHTHIKGVEENSSHYDGFALSRFFRGVLGFIISLCTLFIAYPFVKCWLIKYQYRNTYYDGKKLSFYGKGSRLFGKWILWLFLGVITIGIFILFIPGRFKRWTIKNTHFAENDTVFKEEIDMCYGKSKIVSNLIGTALKFASLAVVVFLPTAIFNNYFTNINDINKIKRIMEVNLSYDGAVDNLKLKEYEENVLYSKTGSTVTYLYFDERKNLIAIEMNVDKDLNSNGEVKNLRILTPLSDILEENLIYEINYKDGSYLIARSKIINKTKLEEKYEITFKDFYDNNQKIVVNQNYGMLKETVVKEKITVEYYDSGYSQISDLMVVKGEGIFDGDNFELCPKIIFNEGITGIKNIDYYNSGTKMILPDTLEYIGENSFVGMKQEELILPSNVKEIDAKAFSNVEISKLSIPEGVTKLNQIFYRNSIIDELVIPNTIQTIERDALKDVSIKKLTIPFIGESRLNPDGISYLNCNKDKLEELHLTDAKMISSKAFSKYNKLKLIELNDGLEEIGTEAFLDLKLDELIIPNGVSSIPTGAFCYADINKLILPKSLRKIEANAFENAYIDKIIFDEGITILTAESFRFANIEEMILPNSVKKIETNAFYNANITTLTINSNIEIIEDMALQEASIYSLSIPFIGNTKDDNEGILYDFGVERTLKKLTITNSKVINSNVLIDNKGMNYEDINEINLDEGVEVIRRYAFILPNWYFKLQNLYLPLSIKTIEEDAFNDSLLYFTYAGSKEDWEKIDNKCERLDELVKKGSVTFLK